VAGLWFSPGTPVSSTNKTDCHDITEILLKVALNTITLINPSSTQPTSFTDLFGFVLVESQTYFINDNQVSGSCEPLIYARPYNLNVYIFVFQNESFKNLS
jgi:hypothetical protein